MPGRENNNFSSRLWPQSVGRQGGTHRVDGDRTYLEIWLRLLPLHLVHKVQAGMHDHLVQPRSRRVTLRAHGRHIFVYIEYLGLRFHTDIITGMKSQVYRLSLASYPTCPVERSINSMGTSPSPTMAKMIFLGAIFYYHLQVIPRPTSPSPCTSCKYRKKTAKGL